MDSIQSFYQDCPTGLLDPGRIEQAWKALRGDYDINGWKLPLPFWGQRGYDHPRDQAWNALQDDLPREASGRAMCIYLHVPFCSSKCSFCDSYSFALSSSQVEKKAQYVDRLCVELDLWSQVGDLNRRPISSVHLGGGTPTFLGEELLARLVYRCIDQFDVSEQTEWALESSTTALTPAMIAAMHELGFRRLHIGVQTLEDPVRKRIGRRQPAAEVLRVIRETIRQGWVVSVDLIVGLPGQTVSGLIDGLQALLDAGVNGVSLYELLIYPQNQKWAARHNLLERDHLPNYLMFQAGAQVLEARGLRKNLFNHWADERDRNIYFTFPLRGEDLLAAGCLADGVFGDYHYRHLGYAEYLLAAGSGSPGLVGGLRRSPLEKQLHPLILAIQSARIGAAEAAQINALREPDGRPAVPGRPLLKRWEEHDLVEKDSRGQYLLTTNGSWFAGNMIAELSALTSSA